jgi:hypothetical protein
VCPNCSLRFGGDREGHVTISGDRLEDRMEPRILTIPDNIDELASRLSPSILNRVAAEFDAGDRTSVIQMLACFGIESHEIGEERVWNVILDRSNGHKHGVRALVIEAKRDWRNLLS